MGIYFQINTVIMYGLLSTVYNVNTYLCISFGLSRSLSLCLLLCVFSFLRLFAVGLAVLLVSSAHFSLYGSYHYLFRAS